MFIPCEGTCAASLEKVFFLFKNLNFDIDSLTGNFNFYVNEASADLSALSKIHKNRASTFFSKCVMCRRSSK